MKELAESLATTFLVNGWEWKFDYGMAVPNEDDIERTIQKAKEVLDSEESETAQLEVGRLIFKKREDVIDIFVYSGTLED